MQNERKGEFMKNTKEYVVPSVSVMNVDTRDIMSNSPIVSGYDGNDNWMGDAFIRQQ